MRELTHEDAEHILARNHIGRLACYSPSHDVSYIVPVSFAYHNGSVYFGTLRGQKLDFLREHPKGACFEVDEITNDQTWLCVIATGDFEEIDGTEREEEVPAAIERALHGPLRNSLGGDGWLTNWQVAEARLKMGALRLTSLSAREDHWSWEVDLPRSLEKANATG